MVLDPQSPPVLNPFHFIIDLLVKRQRSISHPNILDPVEYSPALLWNSFGCLLIHYFAADFDVSHLPRSATVHKLLKQHASS